MSRKVFLAVSAVVMLVLALVVVRFFRDPMPASSQDELVFAVGGAGDSVSGPLSQETEPSDKPSLPPTSSMVMSSGDSGENLRVSEAAPISGDAPAQAATMIRDSASNASSVTEPPKLAEPGVSTVPPVPVSAAEALKPEPRAGEGQPASGGKAGVTGSYGIAASATPAPATRESAVPAKDKPEHAAAPVNVQAASSASDKASAQPAGQTPQKATESSPAAQTEAKSAKPGTLVTKSSVAAKAGVPTVTTATLTMDGDVVTLRLVGSQALKGKSFLLKSPDRVVLDLDGTWNVDAPRVPGNRMVGALRVGNQAQATRLVFDMKVNPAKATVTQIDAKTLELRIR